MVLKLNCFSDKQCYSIGFVSYSYNYTNLNSIFLEFCFTGNILLKEEKSDDLCERLTIIDWEYCSYNYRGFDLGNHFCEWSCDYSCEAYPFYSYHPEDYPSKQTQKAFFQHYLEEQNKYLPNPVKVNDELLQHLYKEANTFAMTSHFFWGLWSVVQTEISDIEFGYLEYAITRFDGYFAKKESNKREELI